MIQAETKLVVADNTGAKMIKCFKVLGGTRKHFAQLGDIIVASVKSAEPRGMVKKGDKVRA
ncbi:MAG: uL14 family ribosomal protein, partial [Candidatus Moraniibacteriota bacterium]